MRTAHAQPTVAPIVWWQRQLGGVSGTYSDSTLRSENASALGPRDEYHLGVSHSEGVTGPPIYYYGTEYNAVRSSRPEFQILSYENRHPISRMNWATPFLR